MLVEDQRGTAAVSVLDARGLYHVYRGREVETVALRGVDISLAPGSWTSVMGPSGSGKSTLLHILAGLDLPTAGRVLLDGVDLTGLSAAERSRCRRERVGLVLQRDNLHPLLNVADNISLPLRLDGRSRRQIRERVRQLLVAIGLADRRRHRPGQLSGGEAQRVALAVALAARPRVLLGDEPTGELDEASTATVLDLLAGLLAEEGTAVLTVTHNRQVAERADRRLTMKDGVLVDA
jgi:putative ABC transport system ATP-binding protein